MPTSNKTGGPHLARRRSDASDDAVATDGLLGTADAELTSLAARSGAGQLSVTFSVRTHRVKSLAFRRDGARLLVGMHSGAVVCYDPQALSLRDSDEISGRSGVVPDDANQEPPADEGNDDAPTTEHAAVLWRLPLGEESTHEPGCASRQVRGVAWCPQDPALFAVGDDRSNVYLGREMSTNEARVEATLVGPKDFIRSVDFHPTRPLLLVASDDQCVYLFDWQSRVCLAVMTGHNHYVMRAVFHPVLPIFASASLDLTVRLWEVPPPESESGADENGRGGGGWCSSCWRDLIGSSANVLAVGEGHSRGVNWVEFVADRRELVTASDDRSVMIWTFDNRYVFAAPCPVHVFCNVNVSFAIPTRANPNGGSGGPVFGVIAGSECRQLSLIREANDKFSESRRYVEPQNGRFWVGAIDPMGSQFVAGHDFGFVGFVIPPPDLFEFAPIALPGVV